MRKIYLCLSVVFLCLSLADKAFSQVIPFDDSSRWEIKGNESKIGEYLGRQSLLLKGGYALLKDSQFTDGIIEYDIAVSGARTFAGAFWRMQDLGNYEEFYIRPHQSGNPDANQYEPVFNGNVAWQLYYGEGYGAPVKYDYNQWMHVKLVISGKNADVYIKDMETPALFVNEMKREIKPGKVGVSVSIFAPVYFSNFSFTPMSTPPMLKGKVKPPETAPVGIVMSWMVSNTIDGKSLESKYRLTEDDKQKLNWKKLGAESTGITNLGQVQAIEKEKNTAFARVIIESDREQIKKVRFAFSDIVRVYFNDQLLYGGSDIYQSRDYRFLGTMGLYDELYLPLKKGDNELWLAVTETLGGWGVKALFENMDGIRIKQ